jgi:hypothetical protein
VAEQQHLAGAIRDNAADAESRRPLHAPEGLESTVAKARFPQGLRPFLP